MTDTIEERARELAVYIIANNATVREAAKRFRISKSTVHKDVTHRLRHFDHRLYEAVKQILEHNKSVRHLRGGDATKRKYQLAHSEDDCI